MRWETWTFQPPQVVIVEDEAIVRLDLAEAFSDAGFDVIEVANAADALEILSTTPDVQALITDIEMLGSMDGVELAWTVRDHHLLSVSIGVVSGRRVRSKIDLPAATRFFVKPYNVYSVIGAVRQFVH
jgi:CheY-like chemotaxis protein